MNIKKLLVVIALMGVANLAFAGKVAILNHERAMMATMKAKQATEQLNARPQYAEMMAQIESLQADLKALAKESESKGMTWSAEQTAEHRKKMEYIQADLQLAVKKIQSEQATVLTKLGQDFQPKMKGILDKIMKQEGIDIILRPDAAYLYVPAIDITEKVTAELDKAVK